MDEPGELLPGNVGALRIEDTVHPPGTWAPACTSCSGMANPVRIGEVERAVHTLAEAKTRLPGIGTTRG